MPTNLRNYEKQIGPPPTDALALVNKKYVDSKVWSGTLTSLPTGWTSTDLGTGLTQINHNLYTTDYVVLTTVLQPSPAKNGIGVTAIVQSPVGETSFIVQTGYFTGSTTQETTNNFFFILSQQ